MSKNQVPVTAIKRFFRLLAPDRQDIFHIYGYAVFSGIVTLTLPLGIQAIINLIMGGAFSSSLVILIVIVTLGTLFAGFLQVMQLTVTETIQRRIFARSAYEFSVRLPRLRIDRGSSAYPPELTNRFFDTLTLQKGLPKILVDFSSAALQTLFGLILISFYHPFFVFFSVSLVLVLFLIFRFTGPSGLSTSLRESKYKYNVAHWLQEVARAMSTFKLASNSQLPVRKTNRLIDKYLQARGQHFRILLVQYGAAVGFKTLITALLLGLGSYLVINNQIGIGQFVAAEIIVLLILNSVEKLLLTMDTIYDVLTGLEKIGYVTDLPLDSQDGIDFSQVDQIEGMAVSMRNLSVEGPRQNSHILHNINLEIPSGQKVCIAGYNGAGKTTLVRVVAGLTIDYQGVLSYNGLPASNINVDSLRAYIGDHGLQEDIFRGSLIENVCLGHESISFDQVQWAIREVGLEEFVQGLEGGYDAELVPAGRNLPQHVKTKLLLARSLVSKPRLIVLEDFQWLVQPSERAALTRAFVEKDRPWTLLAVSNDPIFAAQCDRVVLLEDGEIIADGPFELIRQSKHFPQVFHSTEFNKSPVIR